MDRLQLKTDAKAAMQQASPHPVLVTLVFMVVVFAIQMIVSMMSGFGTLISSLALDPYSSSDAVLALGMTLPAMLLSVVATFVTAFLQLGYVGYSLRVINRHPAGISDLFGYARYFLKAWALTFVIGIFVFLWSLLFYIPGIIAMYRYSQAYYILAENPEKGIMECIEESKTMMIGHKMDKFILDLSFILWYLLICVTCGIASLYVMPYISITEAAFYNSLKYGYNGYGQGYNPGFQQGGYQGSNQNFQQNGYQQGYNQNFQQGGYQQSYDPNFQSNGYQQGYNQNFQQGGYQQGYDPGFQQNGYQQNYDPNFQQNPWSSDSASQDPTQSNQ